MVAQSVGVEELEARLEAGFPASARKTANVSPWAAPAEPSDRMLSLELAQRSRSTASPQQRASSAFPQGLFYSLVIFCTRLASSISHSFHLPRDLVLSLPWKSSKCYDIRHPSPRHHSVESI